MPWLKQGDAAANHPIVLAAVEMDDADDRLLNECFGFVGRCATQAAAYEQDYIITVGTARHMAGSLSRYNALIAAAKYCGYLTEVQVEIDGEQRKAFKLVEDNDLFHMILKAERAWTNQRKRDARDPEKTVPVRRRDGDACRYCGKTVSWSDRVSGRAGSYDHTHPGQEGTIETMVVCCKECNGRRADDPDRIWKTLPAPEEPLYGPATVTFLRKYNVTVQPTYTRATPNPVAPTANGKQLSEKPHAVELPKGEVPAEDEATAQSGLSSDSTIAPGRTVEHAAATEPPAADLDQGPKPEPGQRSPGPSRVGSGRDGTGQVGKGGAGQEAQPPIKPKPQNKPRRRRPRNRGRN